MSNIPDITITINDDDEEFYVNELDLHDVDLDEQLGESEPQFLETYNNLLFYMDEILTNTLPKKQKQEQLKNLEMKYQLPGLSKNPLWVNLLIKNNKNLSTRNSKIEDLIRLSTFEFLSGCTSESTMCYCTIL
jgi:hypothetical protein